MRIPQILHLRRETQGIQVTTEEEKAAMAEKHRFKKNREVKQRLDETGANEEGDIRSFTFHHHELEQFRRKDTRERREDRGENRRESRFKEDRGENHRDFRTKDERREGLEDRHE